MPNVPPSNTWIPRPALSGLVGVPVFSPPGPWPYPNSSAFYGGNDPQYPSPYIMIRPKYVKRLQKSIRGAPMNPWKESGSWQLLANEYAHVLGQDQTDTGGFDGGMSHWPTISRLMRDLMTKAGISPKRQKALIRTARMRVGTTPSAAPTPRPPTPAQAAALVLIQQNGQMVPLIGG